MQNELTTAPELITAYSVTMSPTIGAIAAALAKCAETVRNPGKDATVTVPGKYSFTYATLADSIGAVRAIFASEGIAIVQAPAANGGKVRVTTMFLHSSGEWIASALELSAGKGLPQDVGSAVSYARRYALQAMTMTAPTDDDDGFAAQVAEKRTSESSSDLEADVRALLSDYKMCRKDADLKAESWKRTLAGIIGKQWPIFPEKPTITEYRDAIGGLRKLIADLDGSALMPGEEDGV